MEYRSTDNTARNDRKIPRVYDAPGAAPPPGLPACVTLGVFDGVHLGHRAIISVLADTARKIGVPAVALTFSPHPRLALGRSAPPGICGLEKRLALLGDAGVDAVWVVPFTPELSLVPGRDFAEEYFRRRLSVRAAVLGASAVFGRGRGGNAAALAEWAGDWGMSVRAVPPEVVDGQTVSSTAVRLAVQSGNLPGAERLLGRKVSLEGTVVHGQGHGRNLGFPTLNLDPHHELRPPPGVYLTRAVVDGVSRPSVTNIGRPPTEGEIEAGLTDFLVETHLLDYRDELYGRTVEIVFHRKTRDVMRFTRMSGLVRQVEKDLDAARRWFAEHPEDA